MTTTLHKAPSHLDPSTQKWMNNIKQAIEELQGQSTVPPRTPTNLQVVAQPGGNNIQFTVSDADTYQLFVGSSPDFSQAKTVELGSTNQYSDNVGTAGTKRWYWLRGVRGSSGKTSTLVGPIIGTTGPLGVPSVTAVPVVPAGDRIFTDQTTRQQVIRDQSKETR